MSSKQFAAMGQLMSEELAQHTQKEEFFSELFGFLTGSGSFDNSVSELAECFTRYSLSKPLYKSTLKRFLPFLIDCVKNALSLTQLRSMLEEAGFVEEIITTIISNYSKQFMQLNKQVLDSILTFNKLVDVEWVFGTTVHSKNVKKAMEIFVEMSLLIDCDPYGIGDEKRYNFQLNLTEFTNFLNTLESMKAKMIGN
ncbi:hypothetical protein PCE1_004815 [Barthelona sp. PCE]